MTTTEPHVIPCAGAKPGVIPFLRPGGRIRAARDVQAVLMIFRHPSRPETRSCLVYRRHDRCPPPPVSSPSRMCVVRSGVTRSASRDGRFWRRSRPSPGSAPPDRLHCLVVCLARPRHRPRAAPRSTPSGSAILPVLSATRPRRHPARRPEEAVRADHRCSRRYGPSCAIALPDRSPTLYASMESRYVHNRLTGPSSTPSGDRGHVHDVTRGGGQGPGIRMKSCR